MGHLGTLDPAASGVLPIAAGPATRLIPLLEGGRKRYIGVVRLGITTTTDDGEGEVFSSAEPPSLSFQEIDGLLDNFRGNIQQTPPSVSAIKVNGTRAYHRARKGEEFKLNPRPVTVFSLDIIDYTPPFLKIDLLVSAGTYIRSIARDLGDLIGCGGSLSGLERTYSEPFSRENSHSLEEVKSAMESGTLDEIFTPAGDMLGKYPHLIVNSDGIELIAHGCPIDSGHIINKIPPQIPSEPLSEEGREKISHIKSPQEKQSDEEISILFDENGILLATAKFRQEDNRYRMDKVFIGE